MHVYDIEVVNVSAEDRSELLIPTPVESLDCHNILCLKVNVEMLDDLNAGKRQVTPPRMRALAKAWLAFAQWPRWL
jgi:hypothetical protein